MMRTFAFMLTIVFVAALFGTTAVFAQSSGSFSASYNPTQCAITDGDGTFTSKGITGNSLPPVTVKVSSGSGVALVITPSFVTGLYTNNKLNSNQTTSTQNIGLRMKVTVDGVTTNVIPEMGGPGVIYDQRFIQVTAGFLSSLQSCIDSTNSSTPTDCFTLVQSTLSAHSFNFYVPNLTPGMHTISVSWDILGGTSGEATCVGPGTLTVEQVKNFGFNSPTLYY